ncbi:hypothetical protein ABZT06_07080 [Streptomyces sp. NPDC005483]|uniref:hypothetical protein n=1 Tax=Streptomyces sp. NPDC005483 TaxID=3154882 RepID=UPI0033BDE78D
MDKTVALHTSRDTAISDPLGAAVDRVTAAADFAGLLNSHVAVWERLWRRAKIQVPGQSGRVLRFHLFHLLHPPPPDAVTAHRGPGRGRPRPGAAREAYRGHVFWDELFVLPYLNLHFPDVSRALLNYRYRRLPWACEADAAIDRSGVMFPWQSGSDGREEDPGVASQPPLGALAAGPHKIPRLPVTDNHRLAGMISEADLARHMPEDQSGHFVDVVCDTS